MQATQQDFRFFCRDHLLFRIVLDADVEGGAARRRSIGGGGARHSVRGMSRKIFRFEGGEAGEESAEVGGLGDGLVVLGIPLVALVVARSVFLSHDGSCTLRRLTCLQYTSLD